MSAVAEHLMADIHDTGGFNARIYAWRRPGETRTYTIRWYFYDRQTWGPTWEDEDIYNGETLTDALIATWRNLVADTIQPVTFWASKSKLPL